MAQTPYQRVIVYRWTKTARPPIDIQCCRIYYYFRVRKMWRMIIILVLEIGGFLHVDMFPRKVLRVGILHAFFDSWRDFIYSV